MIKFSKYTYTNRAVVEVDKRLIPLIDAINSLPYIRASFGWMQLSGPMIMVMVEGNINNPGMRFLARCLESRYGGGDWYLKLHISDLPHEPYFTLNCKEIQGIEDLLKRMEDTLNHRNYMREHYTPSEMDMFDLTYSRELLIEKTDMCENEWFPKAIVDVL